MGKIYSLPPSMPMVVVRIITPSLPDLRSLRRRRRVSGDRVRERGGHQGQRHHNSKRRVPHHGSRRDVDGTKAWTRLMCQKRSLPMARQGIASVQCLYRSSYSGEKTFSGSVGCLQGGLKFRENPKPLGKYLIWDADLFGELS